MVTTGDLPPEEAHEEDDQEEKQEDAGYYSSYDGPYGGQGRLVGRWNKTHTLSVL